MCLKRLFCKHRNITIIEECEDVVCEGGIVKPVKCKCNECGKVFFKYYVETRN